MMRKLAVLRSDQQSPCPYGLSIPYGCKNAGSLIHKLERLDQSSNPEETAKSNSDKVENNADQSQCDYAGNIIEDKFVDCQAPNSSAEKSFPKGSPRFYRPMGGVGLEGLNTVPMGFYNDNSVDRGYYYGMYSVESIAEIKKKYNEIIKKTNKDILTVYNNLLNKLAGRKEDVIKQFPDLDVETLSKNDPSGNNKYLLWMATQLTKGHSKNDIFPTVKLFHTSNLKKDIYQFKDLKELENLLKDLQPSKRKQKQVDKSGSNVIFEDENFVVIRPDTKQACITYGKGTRWCITQSDAEFYEQYSSDNVIFYFFLRKNPKKDNYDKIALAVLRDPRTNEHSEFELYDAADKKLPGEPTTDALGSIDEVTSFNKALDICLQDSSNQPKGFFAKLEQEEPISDQELKKWLDLHQDKSMDKLRLHVFNRIPVSQNHLFLNDSCPNIQQNLADTSTDPLILYHLSKNSPDKYARIYAIRNQNFPKDKLKEFYAINKNPGVEGWVSSRIRSSLCDEVPVEELDKIEDTDSAAIRLAKVDRYINENQLDKVKDYIYDSSQEVSLAAIHALWHSNKYTNFLLQALDYFLQHRKEGDGTETRIYKLIQAISHSKRDIWDLFVNDSNPEIRRLVAKNIDDPGQMLDDKDPAVLFSIINRIQNPNVLLTLRDYWEKDFIFGGNTGFSGFVRRDLTNKDILRIIDCRLNELGYNNKRKIQT